MSEVHPVYIRCASGSNAHTDCCIRPHGDCVEILGHPLMHFAPDDAVHFATAMLRAADKTGHNGFDEHADTLRSKIAMALHVPILVDSQARPLLSEASEALAYLDREADYWRREYVAAYLAAMALSDAEIDDGK